MNEVIEQLKEAIRRKAERFTNLDQIQIYNELIEFLDEETRVSMQQEYNISGWGDDEE